MASSNLIVKAYRGAGSVMFGFDLVRQPQPSDNFMGFAVARKGPGDPSFQYLLNRLSLTKPVTGATTTQDRIAQSEGSDQAPFQKFNWVDFPPSGKYGGYSYRVETKYLVNGKLTTEDTAQVEVEVGPYKAGNYSLAFTRGYLSSQAYAATFKNAPIRPAGAKSMDFATAPFDKQYEWLGYEARTSMFDFLNDCLADIKAGKDVTLDMFAYDFDEPDIIRLVEQIGKRARVYLDNAPLHVGKAIEMQTAAAVEKAVGTDNFKRGHYKRFAHNKVLIKKLGGKAVRVLTGSANFSVRGLYVQANSVMVFDEPAVAVLYEEAFEQTWENMSQFSSSEIAEGWSAVKINGLANCSFCFSPHKTEQVSLARVAQAIQNAKSSVLFAIMELTGSGEVLKAIHDLPSRHLFSYGVTQTTGGIAVYKPGDSTGDVVPFAYLHSKVPPPFQAEWNGGPGQVIHHKFIVIDFNGDNPIVYAGSSNLAAGGETSNGDNLIEIRDRAVASLYAVEAFRQVDHYRFRAAQQKSGDDSPMMLDSQGKWWEGYFDNNSLKYTERLLLSERSTGAVATAKAKG